MQGTQLHGTTRTQRTPLADVERRLREHGASKKMREAVLEGIVKAADEEAHPLDLAADEIAKQFRLEPASIAMRLAFVGPGVVAEVGGS